MQIDEKEWLKANFTISDAAKTAIELLRSETASRTPEDSPVIVSVSWGYLELDSGKKLQRPIIGFYHQSQYDLIRNGIQNVSGIDIVFFVTEKDHRNFDNKVLNYNPEDFFYI